ncbi:hypothetical protein ABTY53_25745 [Streptomyces noursei]|uniref:hypothetical protein n=1 Tax=Streptomyces noursei TaxID=1971 RepID=UPI0033282B60
MKDRPPVTARGPSPAHLQPADPSDPSDPADLADPLTTALKTAFSRQRNRDLGNAVWVFSWRGATVLPAGTRFPRYWADEIRSQRRSAAFAIPAAHREVHLVARPTGVPSEEHFTVVQAPVPAPGPGQVLVRTTTLATLTIMSELIRGRGELPMRPFDVGACVPGPSIGEVVDAGDSGLRVGDLVSSQTAGWREYAALDAQAVRRLDPGALPNPAAHLSQGAAA